ncbi:Uncharacterised protein [Mycobacteroides abscessus subsp. abscessus]|nr:Uncharacterised protein [Mycobacteroides abscessus subsp. abscessus]
MSLKRPGLGRGGVGSGWTWIRVGLFGLGCAGGSAGGFAGRFDGQFAGRSGGQFAFDGCRGCRSALASRNAYGAWGSGVLRPSQLCRLS